MNKIADDELLKWAETHPEATMHEIMSWWATAGRGSREIRFKFRNVIASAMERNDWTPEHWGMRDACSCERCKNMRSSVT